MLEQLDFTSDEEEEFLLNAVKPGRQTVEKIDYNSLLQDEADEGYNWLELVTAKPKPVEKAPEPNLTESKRLLLPTDAERLQLAQTVVNLSLGDKAPVLDRAHLERLIALQQEQDLTHITTAEKDELLTWFTVLLKWVTPEQLATVSGLTVAQVKERLVHLAGQSLLHRLELFTVGEVWAATRKACKQVNLPSYPNIRNVNDIALVALPHQYLVHHYASHITGRTRLNILNDEESGLEYTLVTESQLAQSFQRLRSKGVTDMNKLSLLKRKAVAKGHEFTPGNEFVWSVYPTDTRNRFYHQPDLIAVRPRSEDGASNSVALEIEIGNKPRTSYEAILRCYLEDNNTYKKVIWACTQPRVAHQLELTAQRIGLNNIQVTPIKTVNGPVFGFNNNSLTRIQ